MSTLAEPSVNLVIDLINADNGSSFGYGDLVLSPPVPNDITNYNRNTSIVATAAGSSLFSGSQTFYYNRLDFGVLFQNLVVTLGGQGITDISGLLPELNQTYGLGLTMDDLVSQVFPTTPSWPLTLTVVASPTSYAYTGQFQIIVQNTLPIITDNLTNAVLGNIGDAGTDVITAIQSLNYLSAAIIQINLAEYKQDNYLRGIAEDVEDNSLSTTQLVLDLNENNDDIRALKSRVTTLEGVISVNSDWNATSGVAQILNKPTLGTAAAMSASAFLSSTAISANLIMAGPASGPNASPAPRAMVVDDLPDAGVTANVYGDSTHTLQITVDTKGRITAVTVLAAAASGTGTVSSVDLSVPSWLTVAGSPITSAGTLAVTAALGQAANRFLATPDGAAGAVGLRALVLGDLPSGLALLSGQNSFQNQQAVIPYRANISGTVSIDLANTAKSNNLHLTLVGNVTSFTLTNPADGGVYNIRFIQDSSGNRTLSGISSSFKFPGGTAPVLSTAIDAVDFMSLEYGDVEGTYMGAFTAGMA